MNVEPFALITNSQAYHQNGTALRNAREYVAQKIKAADDTVVISGYYGEEFVRSILRDTKFSGRERRLTFVFAGLPEVVRETQVRDLMALKNHIRTAHHFTVGNIDIRLSIRTRFLHAKVFRFRAKNRPPVYLVGSANFSEAAFAQNDEAMVAIRGRHPGLNSYIKHVLKMSESISEMNDSPPARSWRELFRNGYLYFRPNRTVAYTIDPFADDELKGIANRLREKILNPLPFSDRNVLGLNLGELLGLDSSESIKLGFRLPTYSIETDYGYWVPKVYVDFIEKRLEKAFGPKRRALERRGLELQKAGDNYVLSRIDVYLDEVERRIATGTPPLTMVRRQREAIREKIVRRVRHLKMLLTDPRALERLSQTMVGAPVPEFWEDEASVGRFFESICYDIVAKLNQPKSTPKIIIHLAGQFLIRDGDDIGVCADKIREFFIKGRSWPQDNWPPVADFRR